MFVTIPGRERIPLRWATPVLFSLLWLSFITVELMPDAEQRRLLMEWGALSGGLASPEAWWQSIRTGSLWRLVTALFLHADWAHLLGNLVFLLIFGLPAERVLGSWRLLSLFLVGGALANLVTVLVVPTPDRFVIGASGAVSALIGVIFEIYFLTLQVFVIKAVCIWCASYGISLILRLPSTLPPADRLQEVVDQLSGIGGGRQLGIGRNRVRSLPDAVAQVLAEFLGNDAPSDGYGVTSELPEPAAGAHTDHVAHRTMKADLCPECGDAALVYEEGCQKCYSCGFSEC